MAEKRPAKTGPLPPSFSYCPPASPFGNCKDLWARPSAKNKRREKGIVDPLMFFFKLSHLPYIEKRAMLCLAFTSQVF